MNINTINPLVLAYLGDCVFENLVREYLINKGIANVKDLQKESLKYVTAKKQAYFLQEIINQNILTEQEKEIVKRARNTKTNSHPKSCDVITYHHATALEALFGYLKILNQENRINELFEIIKEIENVSNR